MTVGGVKWTQQKLNLILILILVVHMMLTSSLGHMCSLTIFQQVWTVLCMNSNREAGIQDTQEWSPPLSAILLELTSIWTWCYQVRSLESTIHGLEHTIAVGQGAGMEELTEAYMRSEVTKLQQEMDQLVHGTPAQVVSSYIILFHVISFPITSRDDLFPASDFWELGECRKIESVESALVDFHADSALIQNMYVLFSCRSWFLKSSLWTYKN